jgi:methenyltetrahydromethanopterin cyclohydrolase
LKYAPSVNDLASKLLEELIDDPDRYAVKVKKTARGATMIDAGIDSEGGFQAGRLITEICMGGLGKAEITSAKYGDLMLPTILVYTDHPAIATLGSQLASWHITEGNNSAIGSGPARALALKPKRIYQEIGYKDNSDKAIMLLETGEFPPPEVVDRISKDCGIKPDKLTIVLTPTTSLAGATQISGRIAEEGTHKLKKLGLDPNEILHAWGSAPIPPLHMKLNNMMGRTNDAILYGGTFGCTVKSNNPERLARIVEKAPSSASESYGKPFLDIFQEANYDFYKINSDLFAPAVVIVNDVKTGRTFRNGEINVKMLKESFDICNH